jgi:hypothetical protein
MRKFTQLLVVIFLVFLTQGCSDSCLYGGCEPRIYLTIKKELPDTTIQVGENLELNLKEYFQLGESSSGGKFAGYPTIEPSKIDTNIASFSYDYRNDRHGEKFIISSKSSGNTKVELEISWDGGREIAYRDVNFTLNVNSNQ